MKIDKEHMEGEFSLSFPCIRIRQPIGEFYCGVIDSSDLTKITWVDIRKLADDRDVDSFLGIQRELDKKRLKELTQYVETVDACFPTAVLIAVSGKCAVFDEKTNTMTFRNYISSNEDEESIIVGDIAKVLDGQHRIEGLKEYKGKNFQINVSIFVDIDAAEQAYIFSTVNLAQTKVNKSLVYDLFELSRSRSPQKLAHNIAVALDSSKGSPLSGRIKRLGSATPGKTNETITQATFVQALMKHLSDNPNADRELYKRGRKPIRFDQDQLRKKIFRNMMIDEQDAEITDELWNFFQAVSEKWSIAWNSSGNGLILNRTNGFRALMRFLRHAHLYICAPGKVPTKEQFSKVLNRISLTDDDFNIDNFKPGGSGESELFNKLLSFIKKSG
jgi:DGQHR domain-containing protein